MDKAAREALARAAGPANLDASKAGREAYSYDATGHRHPPEAVVRAVDTEQVARVLAACTAHRVPLVPRGAGSGLTGGALAVAGGVVLDMAGLSRIVEIRPADQVAVVEPGVVTADLQAAAEVRGMFYPPDPASVGFCTVGGNLAENAGGLRAVKYGVTRDYVLGITAVLPDGRVFTTGGANLKSVVGYDLTRLLVGSEGTLAVITRAVLRLLPLPEAKATVSAFFGRLDGAADGVRAVMASGIRPVACEFMDGPSLRAVESYAGLGLPEGAAAMILVEMDGPPEVVERQAGQAARLLAEAGGEPVHRAADRAEAERLWKARRAAGPALFGMAPAKLNEDVAVPLGSLAAMVERIHQVAERRGLDIPVFGHAGDGNLHVNILFDPAREGAEHQAHQAVSDIFAGVLKMGGTLSGEHGVGTAKLGYVGAELDPVALGLMRGIKQVFDPAGILNPHKSLPGPEVAA
jgi:glycolate oxidase subunit GlcD